MSIRARLLLIALLACVLPALLEVGRFLQARKTSIAGDTALLAKMADSTAQTLGERVQGTSQLLFGLGRASELIDGNDRAACSEFLKQVREAYPQYTGILTITPGGQLFCDSLHSGRELDLRDRGYFKAAQAASGGIVLEPTFGRLTGIAVLQVARPVRSAQGELLFVLLASLNLPQLLKDQLPTVPGARLMLMDSKGIVLARSPGHTAGEPVGSSIAGTPMFDFITGGAARTSEMTGAGGSTEVWATAAAGEFDKSQIHVSAGVDKAALVAAADRRLRQDMLLLAALALTLFVAVWLVTEYGVRRQIGRITRMARQLAGGDLSARIAPPLPQGELGALMATLNQTAQSLEQQRLDIAELSSRLQQSQRLEAIGQLTGGVAHDFNNLLTVVLGNAELLAEQNRDADAQQRMLAEAIVAAAQRGAELTRGLLAFARKQPLSPRSIDLNRLVAGMDPILRRTLGEHIDIELIRGAGLWPALVDEGQLENALLNLCLNARDAMPDGGRLTIETANARLDTDYCRNNVDVKPGQYVLLAISDSGCGIAADHLQRVFEPFFTTKAKGKGTGLGLAMVYGFVKQSAGHVAIYSEPGQGTTIKLYFPRFSGPVSEPAPSVAGDGVVGGSETILLVEDDDGVRSYAAACLRSFGYQVIEAADGQSALVLVRQGVPVDLLFTDIVMPGGMNGRALADAARQLRPGLNILYTSGYTENAIVHHGRLDPGAHLLSKPYRRNELDRAVREALERG